jgi:tetratricopeptide (TPR) repeat protein
LLANQYLGNLVAEQTPLAAARHWEQTRFYLLKPGTNLLEQAGYLDLGATIHRMRVKHLLAAGDKAGAVTELKHCEQLLPGSIKLVEELLPLLRKAELTDEADDLVENCFQVYAQAVQQFPESANLHNQAAWVAAIAGHRLDDALPLAEEAVRLAPENAAYADTLAEVHFARGDRDKAIEWSRRSLALDPDSKLHAERLESFKTRELPK